MPFTFTMPKLSPTMDAGTIAKWHKKVGDFVESGDLLVEIATDKATIEHHALDEGYLRKILIKEGGEASVNQPIAIFSTKEKESIKNYQPDGIAEKEENKIEPEKATKKKIEQKTTTQGMLLPDFIPEPPLEGYQFEMPTDTIKGRMKVSPLAKKLASEKGMDLTSVKGTGPDGRIVSRDIEKTAPQSVVSFGKRREIPTIPPGTYEEEALSPMRRIIAKRLQEAKTFVPHFYIQQQVNAEPLISLREQLRDLGIKVTINDCIVKACSLALREHPTVNSGFHSANETIISFKTIDLSVAVTVKGGLITPIVRHADYKNLQEISLEIRDLAKRAKEGKLKEHEYKGGSFTVSNLGMYGVSNFQAIINPPQAAIVAVSGIKSTPVVKDGCVVPGKVMTLSFSYDHRVVDGVAGAEFARTVQKYIENPISIII